LESVVVVVGAAVVVLVLVVVVVAVLVVDTAGEVVEVATSVVDVAAEVLVVDGCSGVELRVKTRTNSSSGLDHIKSCELASVNRRRVMVIED
jgi:hypothetical protein